MRRRCKAHPEIPAEIAQGEFGTLHGWLRENIYQHGTQVHRRRAGRSASPAAR